MFGAHEKTSVHLDSEVLCSLVCVPTFTGLLHIVNVILCQLYDRFGAYRFTVLIVSFGKQMMLIFKLCVWEFFFMCVCVQYVCLVPPDAIHGHRIPRNWS